MKLSRTNPVAVRLGRYHEAVEGALRAKRFAGLTELLHAALRDLLSDPIEPTTRKRLELLARFLGIPSDAALAALLDRYAAELEPPHRRAPKHTL